MRLTPILCAALMAGSSASAASFFTNEAAWEAAMVSVTDVTLPVATGVNSFVAGDLTFARTGSATNLYSGGPTDWSSLIAGNDLAVSSPEDVEILFGTAVTGFAFLMHEPTSNLGLASDSCNAACVDSSFNFSLFDGATLLGSFDFDPADDVANFLGFSSNVAFNRVVIDDVTNTIDNEYFGEFRTGVAVVPLPSGLPLLIAGVGVFGVLRRRR